MDNEQMHSALPQLYQKVFCDLYRKRNLRTWGEVRAQHCFSAPYPFLLYSDWYRRMLTGVFSAKLEMNIWFMPNPMWKNYDHEGNMKNEILPDTAELADTCREFMRLRSSLVPYLYTAFYRYHTEALYKGGILRIKPAVYGKTASGSLFIDDGTSFDFEKGRFIIYNFKAEGGRFTVEKKGEAAINNCEIGEPVFTLPQPESPL
ncbi:MAG: DUF5110 domain-containing protein [Treponema sp.]|jgi:hypothetical protein|nr:DUF5110 domain-containing protein [Treponema sp.]